MKECSCCKKLLHNGFYREETGDQCVFCFSEKKEIVLEEVKKSEDFEEVEDKGCAGGACTL